MTFRSDLNLYYIVAEAEPHLDLTDYDAALKWAFWEAKKTGDLEDEDGSPRRSAYEEILEKRVVDYMDLYHDVMTKGSVEVYRGLCLKGKDVDYSKLGIHWSFNKKGAENSDRCGKPDMILTAIVKKDAVNWKAGFAQWLAYGDREYELQVKRGAEVVVTKLNGVALPTEKKGVA